MKKFICSLLPFLLLSAGCAGAAPAETAQSLESVEETENLPEESPFEEPEYEYILNNPYQSYVRYYDGSTWAVTEEGLFVQQGKQDIVKVTLEQWNGRDRIYLFYEEGYVEGAYLDRSKTVGEIMTIEENSTYNAPNARYRYMATHPDNVAQNPNWEREFCPDPVDPCFSHLHYDGTAYYASYVYPGSPESDLIKLTTYRYDFDRKMGVMQIPAYYSGDCIVTNWGLVYRDKDDPSLIRLQSHDTLRQKTLWDGSRGEFRFVNYDDSWLYGFHEQDGVSFVSRLSFREGTLEHLFVKEGDFDSFDVLNGWIYYQDDDGKLIRQSIKEPHRKETV